MTNLILKALEIIAAIVLFGMMAFTFSDVLARYLFGNPLPGGFEATELMMVAVIFAGIPMLARHEKFIAVELIDSIVPKAYFWPRLVVLRVIGIICFAILGWRLWIKANQVLENGVRNATLQIPMYPFAYMMAILSILAAVMMALAVASKRTGDTDSVRGP